MTQPYAELREALEKATKEPWEAITSHPSEGFECIWIKGQPHPALRGFSKEIGCVNGPVNDEHLASATFIALARNELPRLLADYDRMREALGEAIEFAEQDYHALTPAGEEMLNGWRTALQGKDET